MTTPNALGSPLFRHLWTPGRAEPEYQRHRPRLPGRKQPWEELARARVCDPSRTVSLPLHPGGPDAAEGVTVLGCRCLSPAAKPDAFSPSFPVLPLTPLFYLIWMFSSFQPPCGREEELLWNSPFSSVWRLLRERQWVSEWMSECTCTCTRVPWCCRQPTAKTPVALHTHAPPFPRLTSRFNFYPPTFSPSHFTSVTARKGMQRRQ